MSYGYGTGYDASSYGSTTAAARNYYNGTYGNQTGTSASAYRNGIFDTFVFENSSKIV